jgi:murein DD-endopeptidase MepM/ murein hydrolase activator NlpD
MSGAILQSGRAARLRGRLGQARCTLRQLADLWFPDRQLLIRGPGNFTSLKLSQRHQLLAVGLAAFLVLWACLASLAVAVSLARQISETVEQRQLATSVADSQAEIQQLQVQAAQLEALRQRDIAQADAARDQAVATADATVAAYQQKLDQLTQKVQRTIGHVETIIRSTGLNPQALAPRPAAMGRLSMQEWQSAGPGAVRLLQDLNRLNALGNLLTQIPLAAPVAYISVSSPFGFRPDPWTGIREFHVGVDLRGPIGSPVYATAPGTVSFAGVQTGYGNIVIIDHGFGLSTRYSHLSKILVRVGADVDLHQVIGLLGSTGWSTGPHLLYETRVDGQPHDPLNFIKVNRHGLQN